jgi:hypothetical protein
LLSRPHWPSPAKMVHEGWTKDEEAVYFVIVDGPWDINWVKQE